MTKQNGPTKERELILDILLKSWNMAVTAMWY